MKVFSSYPPLFNTRINNPEAIVLALVAALLVFAVCKQTIRSNEFGTVPSSNGIFPCGDPFLAPLPVVFRNISEKIHVPCIVHRSLKDAAKIASLTKEKYHDYIETWANSMESDCAKGFWMSHHSALDFAKLYYPDIVDEYLWVKTGAERSDLIRYFIADSFGGVYADLDDFLLRPFREWSLSCNNVSTLVFIEDCNSSGVKGMPGTFGIQQHSFMTAPHSEEAAICLNISVGNIRAERFNKTVLYSKCGYNLRVSLRTGPAAFSMGVWKVLKKSGMKWRDFCDHKIEPYCLESMGIAVLPKVYGWPYIMNIKNSTISMVDTQGEMSWFNDNEENIYYVDPDVDYGYD